jgi:site-specific recombinase XerD
MFRHAERKKVLAAPLYVARPGKDVVEPNVTPHALRHACGYELAMKGIDTRRLQIYLGHRSITSTTIYTDLASWANDFV